MRTSILLLGFFLGTTVWAAGCSSNDAGPAETVLETEAGASDAGADGAPRLPAGDLGKTCGGGCAGSDICTVSDPSCSTGHCLFDGREGGSDAYCTADCSAAACPTGFRCEDVPFKLTRACVRDKSATPDPSGPLAKGTATVKGTLGPRGKVAAPFTSPATFNAAPETVPANLRDCNKVLVQRAVDGSKKLRVTLNICDKDSASYVPAFVSFDVPLAIGTTNAPAVYTRLGSIETSTLKTYGDFRHKKASPGMTLTVEKATAVQSSAAPFTAGQLAFHLAGTVDLSTNASDLCYAGAPGGSCGEAGPTVEVTVDLDLANITAM